MATEPQAASDTERELDELRARVSRLEDELVEQTERANAAVAAAEDRAYWLDRWHVDLNALMQRRGAAEVRAGLRAARLGYRGLRAARKRLEREWERLQRERTAAPPGT